MDFSNPSPDLMARLNDRTSRRSFLRKAGVAGLAAAVAPAAASLLAPSTARAATVTDADILNFALNLEYLEAEYYSYAVFGQGLLASDTTGVGTVGPTTVKANPRVNFINPFIRGYATEVANDEIAHVRYLRSALGGAAVSKPNINLLDSFNILANAAGLGGTFDPFASQENFLLGSFIFEDVGVTAYNGATPLLTNPDYIPPAGGILVAEAYHAALVRATLFNLNSTDSTQALALAVNKISDVRDSLDGTADLDQGITDPQGAPNIVPTDANSLVFARTTRQVLNIVYGAVNATSGLFFPAGMNGVINS